MSKESMILVKREDVEELASLVCGRIGFGNPICAEANIKCGECCGACLASHWAKKVLQEGRLLSEVKRRCPRCGGSGARKLRGAFDGITTVKVCPRCGGSGEIDLEC
jgi:DnaJ-class molecular chaperone